MAFHGLLDWRLGLNLLRVLNDGSFRCGLDTSDEELVRYPELRGWLRHAASLADQFVDTFYGGSGARRTFGSLPGIENGTQRIILAHPLWNVDEAARHLYLSGRVAEALASAREGGEYRVDWIDSFNLLRRPSWCFKQLNEPVDELAGF